MSAPTAVAFASEPTETDITAAILAGTDIELTGGSYVVNLPDTGVPITEIDRRVADMGSPGFAARTAPAVNYPGTISGDGTVTVRTGFDDRIPDPGQPLTGGVLVFTSLSPQTWGVAGVPSGGHNTPALVIEANTSVAFVWPGENDRQTAAGLPRSDVFPASLTVSRNIVNDGFLFAATRNSWASITGMGLNSFTLIGGDFGRLGSFEDARYSGSIFATANGAKWSGGAKVEDQPNGQPTRLVSRGITVFESWNGSRPTIDGSTARLDSTLVPSNIYNWGLNLQLWWSGVHHFSGMFLPTTASTPFLDLASPADAVKGVYSYNGGGMAFGRVVNLNNGSVLLMGNGQEVVNGPDGITDNTWLQGNPFNTLLSTSNFVSSAPVSNSQALAYAYSGEYRINMNMNAKTDQRQSIIEGPRNAVWTDLFLIDPKKYNPDATRPNHAIVTTPVFFGGLVKIEPNTILQLGDGTTGNRSIKTLTYSDGTTNTWPYSDSYGNGLVITKGNRILLANSSSDAVRSYEIRNDGAIVVDNTEGALDSTKAGASEKVAAWMTANVLDGITGIGCVRQTGTLPLTLGSEGGNANSYAGGTIIDEKSVLIAGSSSAFGKRLDGAGDRSGDVVNRGTIATAAGVREIIVPGDLDLTLGPVNTSDADEQSRC